MSGDMYKVNLLPPKLQREELVDIKRLLLVSGAAVLAVGIIGSGLFFVFSYFTMRNNIAAATQQLTALQPTVSTVEAMRAERNTMESKVKDYKALLQKQMTWTSLLYELDDIAPTDLWLVELDIANVPQPAAQAKKAPAANTASPANTSTAPASSESAESAQSGDSKTPASAPAAGKKGQTAEPWPRPNTVTIKGYSRTVPAIGIFERHLEQLPYFKDVAIKSINSQADGNNFEITAYIKDEIGG
jgi:Tfp pilus assembly protein PilN